MSLAEELQPDQKKQNELSVVDGCILWGSRVVIPLAGRSKVLDELHDGHPGMSRMKSLGIPDGSGYLEPLSTRRVQPPTTLSLQISVWCVDTLITFVIAHAPRLPTARTSRWKPYLIQPFRLSPTQTNLHQLSHSVVLLALVIHRIDSAKRCDSLSTKGGV